MKVLYTKVIVLSSLKIVQKIANEADADLFVSVHCDTAENRFCFGTTATKDNSRLLKRRTQYF